MKPDYEEIKAAHRRESQLSFYSKCKDNIPVLLKRCNELEKENGELRELVLDLFNQACFIGDCYDHMLISSYEEAQRKLIEWGLINKEACKYDGV